MAYPDGVGPSRLWDLNLKPHPHRTDDVSGAEDVKFIRALVGRLRHAGCVDPRRITAAGYSNGGAFSGVLACSGAVRLAAVVTAEATYKSLPLPCRAPAPVSVLVMHGTGDTAAPNYDGRAGGGYPADVPGWLRFWAARDRCSSTPVRRKLTTDVIRFDWPRCAPRTAVAHFLIRGGGHEWAGSPPFGVPPLGSAAAETWRFVAPLRATSSARP